MHAQRLQTVEKEKWYRTEKKYIISQKVTSHNDKTKKMCHAEHTEGLESTLFQPASFYDGNTPVKFKPRFTNIRTL